MLWKKQALCWGFAGETGETELGRYDILDTTTTPYGSISAGFHRRRTGRANQGNTGALGMYFETIGQSLLRTTLRSNAIRKHNCRTCIAPSASLAQTLLCKTSDDCMKRDLPRASACTTDEAINARLPCNPFVDASQSAALAARTV